MIEFLTKWILSVFWMVVAAVSPAMDGDRSAEWRIVKTHWTQTDERSYQDFIRRIGESDCSTVQECMRSEANTWRKSDPPGIWFYADCADFPYILRAYYSWKNGLPFAYVNGMRSAGGGDIRFSDGGNYVTNRREIVTRSEGARINALQVFSNIRNGVSSANMRVHPLEDVEVNAGGKHSDFYSPEIEPGAIRPGTLIYDPNGHVVIVYKIDEDGRVHYVEAHPDNTVTRNVYGPHFWRGEPAMGAGFKNWRPIRLVDARRTGSGELIGGRIEVAADAEIEDYSTVQYFGTEDQTARAGQERFTYNGEELDFFEFVRSSMAGRNLVYRPVDEMRQMMGSLCEDLHYRANSVDVAVKKGLHKKPHISRLPDNIYGTYGEWELYSTPARDARLKTTFKRLRDEVVRFVAMHEEGSEKVAYDGENLGKDLLAAYEEEAAACTVTYTKSDGSEQTLTFDQVVDRLFDLSFSPYHCPELRWGASGEELKSCPDGADKMAWHEALQPLRNQIERTYDAHMGYTRAELGEPGPGKGVAEPPLVDLREYLEMLTLPTG